MSSRLKILFVAAEADPLVKVGGLGDVAGSLPRALRRLGHDVRLVIPRYSCIDLTGYQTMEWGSVVLPFMGGEESVTINQVVQREGAPTYLLENKRYFERASVYGEADDLERFVLFSRAAMAVPKRLRWQPDILHCHDWHTALISPLLSFARREDAFYKSCASVLTIHNLAYQGWFDDFFAWRADLHRYMPPQENPLRGQLYSLLALGIYYSDIVSTVSETYAKEILTPEYGERLESLLKRRRDSFFGIRNGIDNEQFDPEKDPALAMNFGINSLERRLENKLSLQKRMGLPVNAEIPVVAMVSRLADQKGSEIAAEALSGLLPETNIQFIAQGSGESSYEESLKLLERANHRKARILLNPDFAVTSLIFAGCDILLVPSRFEPCGLAPLIGMRYGAIPVVRRTGGLAETVPDASPDLTKGLGFVFERYDVRELLAAIGRALNAYQNKKGWRALMLRAMKADFSWEASIPKYEALYERAMKGILSQ